ncbi:unnamed protein product [Citrullus colocynthis]|uniref:Phosphoribosylformylglycinamidine synthase n=1 Tax=Citrullus colocynthis TaxID=252529 RepID=A0ABP0YWE2_9ROSI
MSEAFDAAGFEAWEVTMSDILEGKISLEQLRGIVFAGGFSYADVLGSAKSWVSSIRFNQIVLSQFQEFYEGPDTFSLGVCNGCQLMALLGWVPGPQVGGVLGVGGDSSQPRFIHNESGRFECWFSKEWKAVPWVYGLPMEREEHTSLMMGFWIIFSIPPNDGILDHLLHSNLAPLRYCDDDGNPTKVYPFNPNGSPLGIAAICSPDGRHLAMMATQTEAVEALSKAGQRNSIELILTEKEKVMQFPFDSAAFGMCSRLKSTQLDDILLSRNAEKEIRVQFLPEKRGKIVKEFFFVKGRSLWRFLYKREIAVVLLPMSFYRFGVMRKLVLDNSYKTDHDVMEKGVKSFISVHFQVERTWNREVGMGYGLLQLHLMPELTAAYLIKDEFLERQLKKILQAQTIALQWRISGVAKAFGFELGISWNKFA